MKQLAYAMDFWSNGALKALFLEHEVFSCLLYVCFIHVLMYAFPRDRVTLVLLAVFWI